MILLGFLFGFTQPVLAQQKFTIKGIITDAKTDKELVGVNISVKGTKIGTSTDIDGYFSLELAKGSHKITFSYIGYVTIERKIKFDNNISQDYKLEPSLLYMNKVVVTAEKENIIRINPNSVSSVSISPRLIEKLPNFGEVDIMRAFQLLPGISASNETSAGLYVRGGTPDQNLILFDGMTIYHVDHFYGFFSAFNANSIDDVELHKGGFPSEFGGRTSSVMEIKGKPADMQKFKSGVGLSLLSANLFTEIPIVKNKLSLQMALRRSYSDIMKSPLYNSIFYLFNEKEDVTYKRKLRS